MTPARAIMFAVAAVSLLAGVALLARLRGAEPGGPQAMGLRISGVIALAFGAMLTTFATSMPHVGGF